MAVEEERALLYILSGQGEEKGVCGLWWLREEKGDEVSFGWAGYIYKRVEAEAGKKRNVGC